MIETSKILFESFLQDVVATHVFSDCERTRGAGPLNDLAAKAVKSGKRIDDRIPYLMTLSGKGGYVDGPGFAARASYRNVTLLDHVLSVARGAAIFGEIDLVAAGQSEGLARRIAVLIATGFLHDADKMLGLSRQDELTPDAIEELMKRYGVDAWLTQYGASLPAADLLSMINAVEMTRSDLLKPGMRLISAREKGDAAYVRLADRLDGNFLDSRKGIDSLIAEIDSFGGFRSEAFKAGWRKIHMRAPHTPFLLSSFQVGLSAAARSAYGMPPVIEMHHDGEFLALIPAAGSDKVIEAAIADALRPLISTMRVDINARGARDILGGAGDAQDLIRTLEGNPADSAKALFVHSEHLTGHGSLRDKIDETMAEFNFMPDFSGLAKFSGKHYQPWSSKGQMDGDRAWILKHAAALAIGMGCADPLDKELAKLIPGSDAREAELVIILRSHEIDVPDWIMEMGKLSRQSLLSILAAGHASLNRDLEDALFDTEGLLNLWLKGDESGRRGLVEKIGDPGAALSSAARDWLRSLVDGTFRPINEARAEGRCHFTNMPATAEDKIDGKSGIDGLKVSAFSGREARPESHTSTKSQTLVSPVAFAEHRLRTLMSEGVGFGKVPAFISSPSMMGLFASLNLRNDRDFLQINQFDMMRLEEKNGKKPMPVTDVYGQRIFFARHFSLPEKQLEIIEMIRMMLRSALRMGRPVHVFRGLPVPQEAFFHIDSAPDVVLRAIGGNSLRIEQIRPAIDILEIVEKLAGINGIGLEVALRFADPETRFAAACEGLVGLERLSEDKQKQEIGLRMKLQAITREGNISMSQDENVIVAFAQAMAGIQEGPRRDTSNSVKTLGLRIALEAVEESVGEVHQSGRESLIAAITGKMQMEFERSGRANWIGRARDLPFPTQKAQEAATLFVDKVWAKAFSGRSPASKARRIATAIYQISFENEHRRRMDERKATQSEAAPEAAQPETETL
jgi:hypothetical protein